ncbi:hypothetical protein WJ972_22200 [Achromobacter insuavis]
MKHLRRHAAAALCALALGASAQAQQEPGITDKTIRIGLFAPSRAAAWPTASTC